MTPERPTQQAFVVPGSRARARRPARATAARFPARRFATLDAMAGALSGARIELIQAGPGGGGRLLPIGLGDTEVQFGCYGAPTLTRGAVDEDRFSAVVGIPAQALGLWEGRAREAGALVVYAPGSQMFRSDPEHASWVRITVAAQRLGRAFAASTGRELAPARSSWIVSDRASLERLMRRLRALLRSLAADPHRLSRSGLPRSVEGELLADLCEALGSARHAEEPISKKRIDPRRIVLAVERHLEDRIQEPIRLAHLAAAAGACERSVEYAFRCLLATTPMRYVKLRRLAFVHRQLRASTPASATVTRLALNGGFRHLSQFAQDYRCVYGESPSETLRGAAPP